MSEESWYKMLIISVVFHIVLFAAFSISLPTKGKRIAFSDSITVGLSPGIGGPGGGGGSTRTKEMGKGHVKPAPPDKSKKVHHVKEKTQPTRKEDATRSITTPKKDKKPSRQELDRLNNVLSGLKQSSGPLYVSRGGKGGPGGGGPGGGGPGGGGGGSGRMLDPATQRYLEEVWNKINDTWKMPGMASYKKNIDALVAVTVRKDGRITDIQFEKKSGNRIFDESINRVLRMVDPLPPLPESLGDGPIELVFPFKPEGIL